MRRHVDQLIDGLRAILVDDLVGIYLHGSLAMGCFNAGRSDLDLLIVTREPMPLPVKRRCVELLLAVSASPMPIEVSFLVQGDLRPWRYPPPYDMHFSETWRCRYERDLATGEWHRWNDRAATDEDLAAHITHLRDRGIALVGPPIDEVFPAVPREDYLESILSDYEWARTNIAQNPVYGVLNMVRVYRFVLEGQLGSKDEAGVWARTILPQEERRVTDAALRMYRGESTDEELSPEVLERFAIVMAQRMRTIAADRGR